MPLTAEGWQREWHPLAATLVDVHRGDVAHVFAGLDAVDVDLHIVEAHREERFRVDEHATRVERGCGVREVLGAQAVAAVVRRGVDLQGAYNNNSRNKSSRFQDGQY